MPLPYRCRERPERDLGNQSSRTVPRIATARLYGAAVAKTRTIFRCTDCGTSAPKWVGRCPACEAWNTLSEELNTGPAGPGGLERVLAAPPVSILELDGVGDSPHPTGIGELDRVLRSYPELTDDEWVAENRDGWLAP